MIKTKKDLKRYIKQDRKALKEGQRRPRPFLDHIKRWELFLRKYEYFLNTNKKVRANIYKFKLYRLGLVLGISSIPANVFDEGLRIAHFSGISISEKAKIGKNCIIFQNVTIGSKSTKTSESFVKIGDNVVICANSVIVGNITIADGVVIGANSTVVKDILIPNSTWAGSPARLISHNNSDSFY